jgi:hypothetical protein
MIDHALELEEFDDIMREACFRSSPLFRAIRHAEAAQKAHPVPRRMALAYTRSEFESDTASGCLIHGRPIEVNLGLGELLDDLELRRVAH